MNYELAKQLKDAGFPHPEGWMTNDTDELVDDPAFYPILEELIEACGDDFVDLQKLMGGQWLSSAIRVDIDDNPIEARGSTPTEAVANLWLALNRN